jgi:putative PIG3 family NAD(P)H quinone oxidoreductase
MRTVEIINTGANSRLEIVDTSIPDVQAEEILIKVSYAGVNRADLFQRQGTYPVPEGVSNIPGLEVSGEVVACGSKVTKWEVGDKVTALITGGGYAEYCTAHQKHAFALDDIELSIGAGIPETYTTVWFNLFEEAKLQAGETFLVHGGASGIGQTAIQLAKWAGANVIFTASNAEKCKACLELGADRAINYQEEDFVEIIKSEYSGVDVVLDMVGGDYIERNMKCLKASGRMVSIAFLRGSKQEIKFGSLLMKRLQWIGSTLRSRSVEEKAEIIAKMHQELEPLWQHNQLLPVIDSIFPLKEVEKAHKKMQQNLNIGKILLEL